MAHPSSSAPLLSVFVLGVVSIGPAAFAQLDDPEEDEQNPIEEIVVSARQLGATISQTAHSVEVFTDEQLALSSDRSLEELLIRLPNIEIDPEWGIIVRGTPAEGYGGDLSTQLSLVDGATSGIIHFWDADQLEILKGGQSNIGSTIGGTFGVIYRPADFSWNSRVMVNHAAKTNDTEVGIAVGGPLMEDTLGFRISAYRRESDGLIDNVLRQDDAWSGHEEDFYNIRLAYRPPNHDGEFTFEYLLLDQKLGASSWVNLIGDDGDDAFRRKTAIESDVGSSHKRSEMRVRYKGRLSERLQAHAIVGASHWQTRSVEDRDGQPSPICPTDCYDGSGGTVVERADNRSVGAGVYLDYDLSPWTLHGLLYAIQYDINGTQDFNLPLDFDGIGSLPGVNWRLRFRFPTDHWWIYGARLNSIYQGEKWSLSASLFFDGESADNTRSTTGVRTTSTGVPFFDGLYDGFLAGTPQVSDQDDYSSSSVSPQLSVGYHINDLLTVGAKVERSFRRGWDRINGYQRRTVDYDREIGTDFDLFLRYKSREGRLRVNANIFQSDIDDMQVDYCFSDNFLDCHIVNAAEFRKRGVELDASFSHGPFSAWVGASWLDAEFRSFDVPGFDDQEDQPAPNAPEWKLSLGLIYDDDIWFGSAEWMVRPGTPGDVTPSLIRNDRRALLNGRLGYRFTNGLEVSLWGRNLLDEEYFERLQPNAPGAYVGAPREVGFTVRKEWGP